MKTIRTFVMFKIIIVFILFTFITPVFAAPPNLGVYRGATQTSRVMDFENWLGRDIQYVEDFMNTSEWVQFQWPEWLLEPWSKSKYKDKLVLSVPLLPDKPDTTTLAVGATGEYNAYFRALGKKLVSNDMPNTILRLGWEMDGGWYRWTIQGGKEESFAAYFREIVTEMRNIEGQNFKFVWNPCIGNQSNNLDLNKAYPGDEYVDYIGIDCYDQAWYTDTYPLKQDMTELEKSTRRQRVWNIIKTGQGGIYKYSLDWFANFAKQHNKTLVVPEWGVNLRKDGGGGGDNPYFIRRMYEWMRDNNVEWSVYFDFRPTDLTDDSFISGTSTNHPYSAKLFRKLWGLGDDPPPQPSKTLLLSDFDDNTVKGWSTSHANSWSVIDSTLNGTKAYKQIQTGGTKWACVGDTSLSNYSVETDVTVTELNSNAGSSGYAVGLYTGSQGSRDTNYYSYAFKSTVTDSSTTSSFSMTKLIGANYTQFHLAQNPAPLLEVNRTYKLKAVLNDYSLELWLDGQKVLETIDMTFSKGRIGLYTYNCMAEFDNVVVRSLDPVKNVFNCYNEAGEEFDSNDPIPASETIKISGVAVKSEDMELFQNQALFTAALYDSRDVLIDIGMTPVTINEYQWAAVDEIYLDTPADTEGCYIKGYLWSDKDNIIPLMSPEFIYKAADETGE